MRKSTVRAFRDEQARIQEAIQAAENLGWHHASVETVLGQHFLRLCTWEATIEAIFRSQTVNKDGQ